MGRRGGATADSSGGGSQTLLPSGATNDQVPELFGEFFSEFRSDVTDVDKILIAGTFVQFRDPERTFTTKAANQALIDQNIKVANASQCVRRLIDSKRVFVIPGGRYRVSAGGLESLRSLKVTT